MRYVTLMFLSVAGMGAYTPHAFADTINNVGDCNANAIGDNINIVINCLYQDARPRLAVPLPLERPPIPKTSSASPKLLNQGGAKQKHAVTGIKRVEYDALGCRLDLPVERCPGFIAQN